MIWLRRRLADGGWEVLLASGILVAALIRQGHWYSWSTASALILFAAVFVANVSGVRATVMVCCSLFSLFIDPDLWPGLALYQGFIIVELLFFRCFHRSAMITSAAVFAWFAVAGPDEVGVYGLTLNIYFAVAGLVVAFLVARLRVLLHVEKENLRLMRSVVENQLRSDLAVRVHDDIAGSLTRVVLRAERLRETMNNDRASSEASEIAHSARQALQGAHHLITGLARGSGSPEVDAVTIEQALRKHSALLAQLGMPVDASIEGTPAQVPPETNDLIRQALAEGVLNVAKHGAANETVRIRLDYGDAAILQIVNQLNANPDAPSTGSGMGIQSMRRAFTAAGGTLHAEAAGNVWMLVAKLPLKTKEST